MRDGDILILRGPEVRALLAGREREIIQAVRIAYETHGRGDSSLPHSTFLRFPEQPRNRIIALPAYLGDGCQVAGIKWVSSFPDNLHLGMDRASAVVILNSPQTGRPEAVLEGSIISAKRTAASAALAAQCLLQGNQVSRVGLIGCGVINFEIARFLLAALSEAETSGEKESGRREEVLLHCPSPGCSISFVLFDKDEARADQFKNKCRRAFGEVEVEVAKEVKAVLSNCALSSIATTAVTPHIDQLAECPPGSTILHISLRDLSPEVILSCDNVVDDIDHVCRAQTSVHLAEQLVGHRDFCRCTLADILRGQAAARKDAEGITVFSPFGLGVLDIAVGKLVRDLGLEQGLGTVVSSFLPDPWAEE
jgi:ornithine cyclodeaminase